VPFIGSVIFDVCVEIDIATSHVLTCTANTGTPSCSEGSTAQFVYTPSADPPVLEPATLALLRAGLLELGAARRVRPHRAGS
jgi:hypothetical protein